MENTDNKPVDKFVDVGERLLVEFKVTDEEKANKFITYISEFGADWGLELSYFCTGDEVFGLQERKDCSSLLNMLVAKLGLSNCEAVNNEEDNERE